MFYDSEGCFDESDYLGEGDKYSDYLKVFKKILFMPFFVVNIIIHLFITFFMKYPKQSIILELLK